MANFFEEKYETMSRDEMSALQSQRLVSMVERCYNNVPLYRKRFDEMGILPGDIKTIEDLNKLPFTYKTDLRDTYPFGMFAVPKEELIRIHASSGTTGKQTVVGYTAHDIDIWARSCARALASIGGTKSDYVHVSYGYGLFTGGLGLHYGAEKLGATAIPVSTGNTKRQVQIMQDYGSDIICCTPSYAMFIGETVREMGIDPKKLKVRAGYFGAEAWTENMRREIEKYLISRLMIFTVFPRLQDRAFRLSVPTRRVCTSTRTGSIPKSSTRTPARFCPTVSTASLCSPASARRRCRLSDTGQGI